MAKILISGNFGWNNLGDEAILEGITQNLTGHNIRIATKLPYNFWPDYQSHFSITSWDNTIDEFDIHLIANGGSFYNLPWKQIINAKAKNKKLMIYGLGCETVDLSINKDVKNVLYEYFKLFDIITVRSLKSKEILDKLGIESILTMDPALNLKSIQWDCPKKMTIVCPRYPDFFSVDQTVQILISKIETCQDEVLLIPFGAFDLDKQPVDMLLCEEIHDFLPKTTIVQMTDIGKLKYLIKQSKLVITNGRYHSLLFAISENVPYRLLGNVEQKKCETLIEMHKKFGLEKLKKMEQQNYKYLKTLI